MNRAISHMDLDTFFVSCERLKNSDLVGKPLIIGGGDRGVVASCSYETRYFGVRSAMPIKMALRLCPEAKVIRGDMEMYSNMSHTVTEIIQEKVPVLEKASIDEFYLDLSGMDKFFGCYQWTTEIAEAVRKNTGLPISFALSTNKTVSKIGTGESKPIGKLEIPEQKIRAFLNPLSVKKIPMVGNVTFQLLSRLGVRNIQTLSEMPVDVLHRLIGKNGQELWKKANAIKPWSGNFRIAYNADGGHKEWVDAVCNQIKNTLDIDAAGEPYATFSDVRNQVTNRTIKTAFRAGWMLDYPSAEDYLNPLYASSSADGHGSNDGDYKSAEFDKLLNAALAQTDVKKRTEDFTKAQEVLAKDLPVIPLWNDNVAAASATNVKNVSFDYTNLPTYNTITK